MSKEIADRFRRMADRIEKNDGEPFGGCAVIVPPGDEVVGVEILELDPAPDASIFWAKIRSKADEAVSDLGVAARNSQAGFARR